MNEIINNITILEWMGIEELTKKNGIFFFKEIKKENLTDTGIIKFMNDSEFKISIILGFYKDKKVFSFFTLGEKRDLFMFLTEHTFEEKEFIKKEWKKERLKKLFEESD